MEFYSDPITVKFEKEPLIEKKTGAPHAFTWREKTYVIVAVEGEWHDYLPRGKSEEFYYQKRGDAPVMNPKKRGSWGVGTDYYRVRTDSGETFIIYYNRQPKGQKKGEWVLIRRE